MVAAIIGCGVASSQAQWTYYDAADGTFHTNGNTGAWNLYNVGNGNPAPPADDPFTFSASDGQYWRFRNTGPANVSFGGSSYQGRNSEGDGELYQTFSGLTPGGTYTVRLYGIWASGNTSWGLGYSFDGSSWSASINRDTIHTAWLIGGGSWVAHDTLNDLGSDIGGAPAGGDSRGWIIIGTLTADGAGNARVYVRNHGNPTFTTERGVFDGIALAEGIVPEPSSFALAGLASAALLIFRRRK